MKFSKFLDEMTMKAGNLDVDLKRIFAHYDKSIRDSELEHIGDIDSVKIMRYKNSGGIVDFLVKDDQRIGIIIFSEFHIKTGKILEIDDVYVIPEEQRKGIFLKYLYFLKNVLKRKFLFGSVHSIATQNFLKKSHELKRFDISWYNLDTNEKEPFENDKYSLTAPTKWRVMIESDENSTFNQFKTSDVGIKNSYEWLFDSIDKI